MMTRLLMLGIVLSLFMLTGCGHYPAYISSRFDIALTSANETQVVILKLPLEDYPALGKFQGLYELRIEDRATDETLRVLAEIGLPRLGSLSLPHCSAVTDRGLEYLLRMPSIRDVGLTGREITDRGVVVIARMPNLTGCGIDECTSVTAYGLVRLAQVETLEELAFPAAMITQTDLLRIIDAGRHLKWIVIDEPAPGQFDAVAVRRAVAGRNIYVLVCRNHQCDAI